MFPYCLSAAPGGLPPWLDNVVFPLNRWGHMVGSTLIVGGILFFEFVVPLATADLKEEQQLAVFGRARWVFRKVAWTSILLLVFSGSLSAWRMWRIYAADLDRVGNVWLTSAPWVIGHVALGLIGMSMALRVTNTRHIRDRPIGWMRATLVALLASMFAASVARQVRLHIREWRDVEQTSSREAP